MIKLGDRVKFINDIGVGKVMKIEGAVVTVDREDGFEVPALISELVVVEKEEELQAISRIGVSDYKPGRRNGKGKKEQQAEKKQQVRSFNRYGKVSLVDDYEDEEIIDLNSIRDSYTRNMAAVNQIAIDMEKKEQENAKAKEHEAALERIKELNKEKPLVNDTSIFDLKDLSKVAELYEPKKEDGSAKSAIPTAKPVVKEDDKVVVPKKVTPKKSNDMEIVDLHSHQLLETEAGMSSGDILTYQLGEFQKKLNALTLSKRHGRIIFIHGVGSGKLKYELGAILKRQYPNMSYQDASFREYGYGAIMVIY